MNISGFLWTYYPYSLTVVLCRRWAQALNTMAYSLPRDGCFGPILFNLSYSISFRISIVYSEVIRP